MLEGALRVLVIEDDADVALYTRTVLEKRAACQVLVLASADGVAEVVAEFAPDVVITDVELPGSSGLDILEETHRRDPDLPVIVMTAHASVDYAVRALRDRADEFLTKPVSSADLVAAVTRLGARARAAAAQRRQRTILAIGAHPDDVELGVGGILAAHAAVGDPIVILTLSRGARGGEADDRQDESLAAAELVGARLFLEDLEDTRIPNADPTVAIIERVVAEVKPSIIYTHSRNDRHQDHRAVHEASLVATRSVPTVACYQSPSSTVEFRPSRFVPIDGQLETKLALLRCFASQSGIRSYLEPDFVLAGTRYWSRFGRGEHCEPLEIVRDSAGIGAPLDGTRSRSRITQVGEEL
ncbi:response regulator [Agromyces salentinus]|uniref:Response regulatory domain-containing protein n=1 Tax=Agromyces salentinus TaxID=269421 RepID=A0ABN2MP09_9MICO|nr:response regulator [Agromyces salentinus]